MIGPCIGGYIKGKNKIEIHTCFLVSKEKKIKEKKTTMIKEVRKV